MIILVGLAVSIVLAFGVAAYAARQIDRGISGWSTPDAGENRKEEGRPWETRQ